jgi:hypothetical protein
MKKKITNNKRIKKPWPTQRAMNQVYKNQLWGTNGTTFYSGEGSHDPVIVQPYIQALNGFLRSFKQPLSICDLGCGDFNIGKQISVSASSYIGIDIVPDLVTYCHDNYANDHCSFLYSDIAKDELPSADVAILRQVLQHLSNEEILQIIPKLYSYKYLVLTEHLPLEAFIPNADIISGQGIRLKKKSGVVLTAAPFDLNYKSATELVSTELLENKGMIKTICYEL